MKVATVRLSWSRSPSADVTAQKVLVTIDGTETVFETGPQIEEWTLDIKANSSVQFRLDTYDSEGKVAQSATLSFTIGDLEDPLPATNLAWEIVGVRDVEDPPVAGLIK